MPRVSKEMIDRLEAFFDLLPDEAKGKCALCNETLTHIVKSAEAQAGAGTATVTRLLSEKINDGAAPGDQVNGQQLRRRVQRADESICPKRADNPEQLPTQQSLPTKWTCTVCGKSYPMDTDMCECQGQGVKQGVKKTPSIKQGKRDDPPAPPSKEVRWKIREGFNGLKREILKDREKWTEKQFDNVLAHLDHLQALTLNCKWGDRKK